MSTVDFPRPSFFSDDRSRDIGREQATWKAINVVADSLVAIGGYQWHIGDGHGGGVFHAVYDAARRAGLDVGPSYHGPRDEDDRPIRVSSGTYQKASVPVLLRWSVWERDDFRCQRCGSRQFLAADHIIPESKGGATTLDNLQTLCRSCNSRKGARPA